MTPNTVKTLGSAGIATSIAVLVSSIAQRFNFPLSGMEVGAMTGLLTPVIHHFLPELDLPDSPAVVPEPSPMVPLAPALVVPPVPPTPLAP